MILRHLNTFLQFRLLFHEPHCTFPGIHFVSICTWLSLTPDLRASACICLSRLRAKESSDRLVYLCQTDTSLDVRAKAKEALLSFGKCIVMRINISFGFFNSLLIVLFAHGMSCIANRWNFLVGKRGFKSMYSSFRPLLNETPRLTSYSGSKSCQILWGT